jgi:hypothetical protein
MYAMMVRNGRSVPKRCLELLRESMLLRILRGQLPTVSLAVSKDALLETYGYELDQVRMRWHMYTRRLCACNARAAHVRAPRCSNRALM